MLSETTSALSLALENGGAVELFYEVSGHCIFVIIENIKVVKR